MKEFINFWKFGLNFKDRTTRRGYWMAYLWFIIISIAVGLVSGILEGAGVLGVLITYEMFEVIYTINILDLIFYGIAVVSIVPYTAIFVRRLHDIGKPWTHIFLTLIPLVGFVLALVWLCTPSSAEENDRAVV